jgi:hypothetical protein
MSSNKYQLKYIVVTVAVVFGSLGARSFPQQHETQTVSMDKLLETRVADFELHNETLLDGLWKLARIPVPFGFGFESVLKSNSTIPEIQDPQFSLQLKDKSAREILNALCQADSRYMWSIDGTTVNVFPKDILSDPSYLLNRKLARFELKNSTDVDDGLLAISRQLPPPVEQVAHVQMSGDDSYPPEPWTVTYENLTVRQVVNRLAEHGGPCGTWTFGGSKDFRRFAFFNNLRCLKKKPPSWIKKITESRAQSPQNDMR